MDYPGTEQICPHCQRVAAFNKRHLVRLHPKFESIVLAAWDQDTVVISGGGMRPYKHSPFEVNLVVFQCQGCGGSAAFHEFRVETPSEDVGGKPQVRHWFELSYPKQLPRRLPGEGVPEAVRSFYEEGGIAEAAGARRAAAAMFRGSVEAICDALDIPRKGNLRDRVDDLATKGVDRDIVDDLHEARLVGNDSLHDGTIYAADELADVADLIADAVRLAFVQPAEKKAMREKRRERREVNRAQTGMVRG